MLETGENDSPLENKPTKVRKPWILTEARAEALRKCRERRAELVKEKNKNKKLQQLEKKEEKIKQKKEELIKPVEPQQASAPAPAKAVKKKKQVIIEESADESETSSSSSVEVIIKKKPPKPKSEKPLKVTETKIKHAPPAETWYNTQPNYIFL